MTKNRADKINTIRSKLSKGEVSIGTWQQIPHPSISEILGNAGFDWVAVDLEHGSVGVHQLPDLFRAIELGGSLPLARIAMASEKDCRQALDAGAGGVIIPMIKNAQQLEELITVCQWPPAGTRGVGFCRANLYGKYFDDYKNEAKNPLIIAQIENKEAVENINSILSVNGVDAIIIGPYDLSASMGITGEFSNCDFINALSEVINICDMNNIPAGIHVVNADRKELKNAIGLGYKFVAYSIDAQILLNHKPYYDK